VSFLPGQYGCPEKLLWEIPVPFENIPFDEESDLEEGDDNAEAGEGDDNAEEQAGEIAEAEENLAEIVAEEVRVSTDSDELRRMINEDYGGMIVENEKITAEFCGQLIEDHAGWYDSEWFQDFSLESFFHLVVVVDDVKVVVDDVNDE